MVVYMRTNFGMPSCAAIHDISGIGKCSLTVALPILSCMGVETGVLPTAVLSNHTGFSSFSYRDLTEDILGFARRWKEEAVAFDAVYSGFLGSQAQIGLVAEIFEMFRTEDNLIIVDPVMGDAGKLYKTYTPQMAEGVRGLCKLADVIVPNMTEAAYLIGEEYKEGPYTREYTEEMLKKLMALGPKTVVLTGVWEQEDSLGSACISRGRAGAEYCFYKKYPGSFHGTGDVFASVLTGALIKGLSPATAQDMACAFVGRAIDSTVKSGRESKFGVFFEPELPWLFETLREKLAI